MPAEKPIPTDYIEANKKFWRESERGGLSKPLELTRTARLLHNRMIKTFNLEDAQEPILTWSVLFDRPKTPSAKYVYQERIPAEVSKEDAPDFFVGIARITEYATNRATKLFIERNMDLPFLKELGGAYARFADLLTYEILLNGTYRRMARVEAMASRNGKDYNAAIEEALFRHDFEPINALVADTREYSGWSNLTDVAVEIGKKKHKKPDLAKWMDKLEIEDDNNRFKRGLKSVFASVGAGGVFRSPGISEVSGGMMGFLMAETGLIYVANLGGYIIQHPESLGTILPFALENIAAAAFPAIVIAPAIGIHELTHGYSSNENFYGLIPATLVDDERIPYLARLLPGPKT